MKHILMVCLGNICRSPMAEGILRHHLDNKGLKAFVDSAGTSAWHQGEPPDTRAVITCRKRGVDISGQRSRPFIYKDFDRFDLIFAMDNENCDNILSLTDNPEHKAKVHMIMDVAGRDGAQEIPDPYYGGEKGFEKVFDMLEEGVKALIDKHFKASVDDK